MIKYETIDTLTKQVLEVPKGYYMIAYDVEVFSDDWIVVLQDVFDSSTRSRKVIVNDVAELLKVFLRPNCLFIGYNSSRYDDIIITGIKNGSSVNQDGTINPCSNASIKDLNDWLINGYKLASKKNKNTSLWDHPLLTGKPKAIRSLDLMADLGLTSADSLSLKQIMYALGENIQESSVDFNINRKLTQEELQDTINYCIHDVETTVKVFHIRQDLIRSKCKIAEMLNMPTFEALGYTNATLTAKLLGATSLKQLPASKRDITHTYTPPANLKLGKYEELLLNFIHYYDKIKEDEIIKGKNKGKFNVDLTISGTPLKFGLGGVHGSLDNRAFFSNEEYVISNYDVTSYYPTIMINNGTFSRYTKGIDGFKDIYAQRVQAKVEGNKAIDGTLKLVLNTTFGSCMDKYNDLYDPDQGTATCLTGQLYLLDLVEKLEDAAPELEVIQVNTDGVMVRYLRSNDKVGKAINEWQERTHLELGEDIIDRIYQKDVNNYVAVLNNGKVKACGSFLKYYDLSTISRKEVLLKVRLPLVCAEAIVAYLVNDTPLLETIQGQKDITKFSEFSKPLRNFKQLYHKIGDSYQPIQTRNRIYAVTADGIHGTLYKTPIGSNDLIPLTSTPPHVLIDNPNSIKDIKDISLDYGYYYGICIRALEKYDSKSKTTIKLYGK